MYVLSTNLLQEWNNEWSRRSKQNAKIHKRKDKKMTSQKDEKEESAT
jgi:hypothetical protein